MAEQNGNENFNANNVNVDQLINEAEERFRKGMTMINQWGSKAGEIIQRQPAAVLAGVAVLGFVTGLVLRRAVLSEDERD